MQMALAVAISLSLRWWPMFTKSFHT